MINVLRILVGKVGVQEQMGNISRERIREIEILRNNF